MAYVETVRGSKLADLEWIFHSELPFILLVILLHLSSSQK